MNNEEAIKDFLSWMNRKKICSVISFFVIQEGRNGKIPHWTDGKKIYDANELFIYYQKTKNGQHKSF